MSSFCPSTGKVVRASEGGSVPDGAPECPPKRPVVSRGPTEQRQGRPRTCFRVSRSRPDGVGVLRGRGGPRVGGGRRSQGAPWGRGVVCPSSQRSSSHCLAPGSGRRGGPTPPGGVTPPCRSLRAHGPPRVEVKVLGQTGGSCPRRRGVDSTSHCTGVVFVHRCGRASGSRGHGVVLFVGHLTRLFPSSLSPEIRKGFLSLVQTEVSRCSSMGTTPDVASVAARRQSQGPNRCTLPGQGRGLELRPGV